MGGEHWDYAFAAGALPVWNVVASGPERLASFLDIDLVANVTQVRFSSPARVGREVVEVLHELPHLKSVLIVEMETESSFISALGKLPQLRSLSFERVLVTDSMIEQLSQLQLLEELRLVGCTISDKSLPALATLRHLKKLDVSDTKMSWSVIWRLEQLLPECHITPSIWDHENGLVFTRLDDAVIEAASGLPAIERVDWPIDIISRLGLTVTQIRSDGAVGLKGWQKCRVGRRAWQTSFQGNVHISHIRINERGGQGVSLKDFTDLQGAICEDQ